VGETDRRPPHELVPYLPGVHAHLAPRIWLARPEAPPAGRRLAVKDLLDTAGLVTTYGSSFFDGHVPERSARSVVLVEAAGWATVGKTNLHEFAYGITSQNPHYGDVPNPVLPGRTPGGSSGGSAAAVAAGEAEGALGTDSGGSIRIPAACCGVAGFKPTHGAVPADGCFPLAPTFDHVGPIAGSVATCEELFAALAPGYAPHDLTSLEELEVGVLWTGRAEPAVREEVERAARAFPRRRTVDLPVALDVAPVFMREVAEVHRERYSTDPGGYGHNVGTKVARCLSVPDDEHDLALRRREQHRERLAALFDEVDLLVTPTLPCLPPAADVDELLVRESMIRFTFPFNATGAPALALPAGSASVQLVGAPGRDALVLAAGRLLEEHLAA
jgi:Asp-tRNA(Asn)/Glu-tRNA(Gln) amidotransferase A subunit family amidase